VQQEDPSVLNGVEPTVWLSGEFITLLNKLVFPIVWLSVVAGFPLWVFIKFGHISIANDFRFFVAVVLIATGFMVWLAVRLQRVGYSGRELVLSNYWREARVPFNQVEAVEPVWWYRRRMVRIRFSAQTPFGQVVYYLPKWAFVRFLMTAPDEELRRILW
jgi:hypothetical protein